MKIGVLLAAGMVVACASNKGEREGVEPLTAPAGTASKVSASGSKKFVAYLAKGSSLSGTTVDRATLAVALSGDSVKTITMMAEEKAEHAGPNDPLPESSGFTDLKELEPYDRVRMDGMNVALFDMSKFDAPIRTGMHQFSFFGMKDSGGYLNIDPAAGWSNKSGPDVIILYDKRLDGTHAFGVRGKDQPWQGKTFPLK